MSFLFIDNRPQAKYRIPATDHGIVLRYGDGPNGCDALGAREAQVHNWGQKYALFYDGAAENGWSTCLAVSEDLLTWEKRGIVLPLGKPGENDAAAATSPWVIYDNEYWHMFYVAAPFNGTGNMAGVPTPPYYTLKARSKNLIGPYEKQPKVAPFTTAPKTYYSATASAGHIVETNKEYVMFFSASVYNKLTDTTMDRTVSIARTKDLNGTWVLDKTPAFPINQQIENTFLYFEKENGLWFMFTNHIGTNARGLGCESRPVGHDEEYTDAIWVYWSPDINHWNPDNRAVVLDGGNCTWANRCIGLPSAVVRGDTLCIMYDSPGGESVSHLHRNIGLCTLSLPLQPPVL